MTLIDKQLYASSWYTLTNTGDFSTVDSEESVLQAAQNRILSQIGSWIYDDDFGSSILELRNTAIPNITYTQIRWYIQNCLQPMIDDSRISSITSVKILEKGDDYIQVEIKLDLALSIWTLNINIGL